MSTPKPTASRFRRFLCWHECHDWELFIENLHMRRECKHCDAKERVKYGPYGSVNDGDFWERYGGC